MVWRFSDLQGLESHMAERGFRHLLHPPFCGTLARQGSNALRLVPGSQQTHCPKGRYDGDGEPKVRAPIGHVSQVRITFLYQG